MIFFGYDQNIEKTEILIKISNVAEYIESNH